MTHRYQRGRADFADRHTAVLSCLLMMFFAGLVHAGNVVDLRTYKMGPGDRIAVTVYGQAELSGEFPVDGVGNIIFPLIGAVSVIDLTILECQTLITERLKDGILNDPSVNVRLADFRPIQVTGDVRTPGVYPFLQRSLVKSAVAQAGGYLTVEQTQGSAMADFLVADERVRVLRAARRPLLIRQARLDAQKMGAKTFTAPDLGPEVNQQPDVLDLIRQERGRLSAETEAIEKQVEIINSQQAQYQRELETLEGQVESEKEQMELVRKQLETYDKLVQQGLGRANARIEIQLAEASRKTNIWRLEGDQSRIRNQILDLNMRLHDLQSANRRLILTELQDLRQRLQETDISLASAEEIRQARLQQAGGLADAEVTYDFKISRVRGAEVVTIEAAESTFLEPGDIVEVRRKLPKRRDLARTLN